MTLGKLNIDYIDTSKLVEFSDSLTKMPKLMEDSIRSLVFESAVTLKTNLKNSTPISSGAMRGSWSMSRMNKTTGTIASVSIQNRSVQGPSVELGVAPGTMPWPSPTKGRGKLPGRKRVPERTVMSKGRIWSTQAVGGITPKVISASVVNLLSKRIASSLASILVK